MPTDECIVDNYKKSKEEYPNSISFEREIEEAKKWVSNENLKFAEKYPDQIPQPEQTVHYHIVRNLLFVVKKLTARAEQAEKERDAVEKSLARRIMQHLSDYEFDSTFVCEICEYNLTNSPKCLSCGSDHHHGKNFELKHILSGQPQEGEKT